MCFKRNSTWRDSCIPNKVQNNFHIPQTVERCPDNSLCNPPIHCKSTIACCCKQIFYVLFNPWFIISEDQTLFQNTRLCLIQANVIAAFISGWTTVTVTDYHLHSLHRLQRHWRCLLYVLGPFWSSSVSKNATYHNDKDTYQDPTPSVDVEQFYRVIFIIRFVRSLLCYQLSLHCPPFL